MIKVNKESMGSDVRVLECLAELTQVLNKYKDVNDARIEFVRMAIIFVTKAQASSS